MTSNLLLNMFNYVFIDLSTILCSGNNITCGFEAGNLYAFIEFEKPRFDIE